MREVTSDAQEGQGSTVWSTGTPLGNVKFAIYSPPALRDGRRGLTTIFRDYEFLIVRISLQDTTLKGSKAHLAHDATNYHPPWREFGFGHSGVSE